jgi:hypothetical protein
VKGLKAELKDKMSKQDSSNTMLAFLTMSLLSKSEARQGSNQLY